MKKIMRRSDNIHSFLDSLTYWQTINLFTVLNVGQNDVPFSEAKEQAMLDFADTKKLEFLLEQTLNSPDPKI
ncbi:hypothetical protein [Limosilactobacillus reuteri]|uniref:hypothetical protein n=1 Tax=Limosilactobacillus reuteri TaxID=1598 RepID=UPI001E39F4BC|nr:hypothetical protein [Limosilactobacillus reuteri]MCC4485847.1 hypothetical protein [Limosilactobacillus reuteri]